MKNILVVISLFCSTMAQAQQKLFWYIDHGKMGYKDAKGNTVIKPAFVLAGNFSEGLAMAGIGVNIPNALYGFINDKGIWVIKPAFNAAGDFSDGLARVSRQGRWGYIDKTGKMVIPAQFYMCYEFEKGYAQASKGGKWGIIDKKGAFVVAPDNYDVTNVCNGVLGISKTVSSGWELADLKGNKVSKNKWSKLKDFNDGMAPARDDKDMYGFISLKGDWLIKPKYTNAEPFSEGLAAVEIDYANWGFIDKTGKLVIPAMYSSSARFRNGVAMIEKDNEYMYIDKKGKVILRFNK